jgi:hypothetical protein
MVCGFVVTPHALLNERASVLFQRRETVYCPNRATFHLQTVGSCFDTKNDYELCTLLGVFTWQTGSGNT